MPSLSSSTWSPVAFSLAHLSEASSIPEKRNCSPFIIPEISNILVMDKTKKKGARAQNFKADFKELNEFTCTFRVCLISEYF